MAVYGAFTVFNSVTLMDFRCWKAGPGPLHTAFYLMGEDALAFGKLHLAFPAQWSLMFVLIQ